MKILFWASQGIAPEHLSILVEKAIQFTSEGHQVFFVYNNCNIGICTYNISRNSYVCAQCLDWMASTIKMLPKSITKIDIKDYWLENKRSFSYTSIRELKKIEYKDVKVGYAVMSSYITMTRNLMPKIDENSRPFFDHILSVTFNLIDALDCVIDYIKPDRVCFFNSRFFEWRPPYDLAKSKGITTISYEHTDRTNNRRIMKVVNSTFHNIINNQALCHNLWDTSELDEYEKKSIGKSFFEKRRAGIRTNDNVYTASQEEGKLPEDWDESKRNIVIFNSSEDEFASIGDEYDNLALFPTQYRGIIYIAEALKDEKDIHIYLRIHPNLKDIQYRYHTELEKLAQIYPNLTVIPAANSVSTYSMMDAAEKVVVFGSTMGVESVYWGKPVILLAGACYYYSDICYIPKSKEELRKLLVKELEPMNNEEAIKWGFYFLKRDTLCDTWKYVSPRFGPFGFGKYKWYELGYLKLFGSSKLRAIWSAQQLKPYRKNIVIHHDVPMDEDDKGEL